VAEATKEKKVRSDTIAARANDTLMVSLNELGTKMRNKY